MKRAQIPQKSASSSATPWRPFDALVAYLALSVLPLGIAIWTYFLGRVGFISSSAGRIFLRDDPFAAFVQYVAALIVEIGIVLGLMRLRKATVSQLGLAGFKWRWVFAVLGLYILQAIVVVVLFTAIQTFSPSTDLSQKQEVVNFGTTHWAVIASFVAAVFIAPILEELIFRGIMFQALDAKLPTWAAAVVSSAAFGWLHGQLNVGIYTFVLGLLLVWLFRRSKSIYPGILLHMLNNAVAFWFILQLGK